MIQVQQRGTGALIVSFCVPRIGLEAFCAAAPDATIIADDSRFGSDTWLQLRLMAKPQPTSPLVLVGFGPGCARVRQLWREGARPVGMVLVNGIAASMPPKPWELDAWRSMASEAGNWRMRMVAAHTLDRSCERHPHKDMRTSSAVSVLRTITGLPLVAPGTASIGSLDVITHAEQKPWEMLPELLRKVLP